MSHRKPWFAIGNLVAFMMTGYQVVHWYNLDDIPRAIFWLLLTGWFWTATLGNTISWLESWLE